MIGACHSHLNNILIKSRRAVADCCFGGKGDCLVLPSYDIDKHKVTSCCPASLSCALSSSTSCTSPTNKNTKTSSTSSESKTQQNLCNTKKANSSSVMAVSSQQWSFHVQLFIVLLCIVLSTVCCHQYKQYQITLPFVSYEALQSNTLAHDIDLEQRQYLQMLGQKQEAWKQQVQALRKSILRESRRAVIEKFGDGTHYVEFTIVLPTDADQTKQTFVVEMAPLDLVPHSVHLFLEQVDHGLWDNTCFYWNGPHILVASPLVQEEEILHDHKHEHEHDHDNLDESSNHSHHTLQNTLDSIDMDDDHMYRSVLIKDFIEDELDTLAFPDYSEQYPHLKWTLGFNSRPGGPEWYINKKDNSDIHGPGASSGSSNFNEDGDSCFGKVISGYETIQSIYNQPTVLPEKETQENGWEYFFGTPVHIVEAKVTDGVA